MLRRVVRVLVLRGGAGAEEGHPGAGGARAAAPSRAAPLPARAALAPRAARARRARLALRLRARAQAHQPAGECTGYTLPSSPRTSYVPPPGSLRTPSPSRSPSEI